MGFGEIIYSKTKSAIYSRRETRCNGCDSGIVEVKWNNIKNMCQILSVFWLGKSRREQENHGFLIQQYHNVKNITIP
jgi:hypothetical protein